MLGGVTFDTKGNAILTGAFKGEMDFGGGALTALKAGALFLAKLDKTGAHVWSKQYGTNSDFNVSSITTDRADSVVYGGGFTGTVDFGTGPLTTNDADGGGAGNYDGVLAKLPPVK